MGVHNSNDIPATAAITTIGATFGDVLFAVKADAASSTVACFRVDANKVNEIHSVMLSKSGCT
jgi:hypothetical protein